MNVTDKKFSTAVNTEVLPLHDDQADQSGHEYKKGSAKVDKSLVDNFIHAEKRVAFGKKANQALKNAGLIPAKIDRSENEFISVDQSVFTDLLHTRKLISNIFKIEVDGVVEKVVVKEYQKDPVTGKIINIDFVKIHNDKFIELVVPMFYINKSKSVAIKKGAFLNVSRYYVKIKFLGENIKSYFIIDLDGTDVHKEFKVKDLELPQGAKLVTSPEDTLVNFRGKRGQALKE